MSGTLRNMVETLSLCEARNIPTVVLSLTCPYVTHTCSHTRLPTSPLNVNRKAVKHCVITHIVSSNDVYRYIRTAQQPWMPVAPILDSFSDPRVAYSILTRVLITLIPPKSPKCTDVLAELRECLEVLNTAEREAREVKDVMGRLNLLSYEPFYHWRTEAAFGE